MDRALALKEQGKFRFLGLSGHDRKLFPELAQESIFDVFHLRYNAPHRGAETGFRLTGTCRPRSGPDW